VDVDGSEECTGSDYRLGAVSPTRGGKLDGCTSMAHAAHAIDAASFPLWVLE
jgi:hypothetical protein